MLTSGPVQRPNMRHQDTLNRSADMADFWFFKMARAAILDFGNFKYLTVGTLERVELRLRAKFCRNRSNRGWDIAIFRFFMMAAVRHLGFLKVGNFNFRSHWEAQYASPYQIPRRSVEPFQRYGRFSNFQDGGRPPSWIGFTRCGTTHEKYLVVFVTVQNLVVIGAAISIVGKF